MATASLLLLLLASASAAAVAPGNSVKAVNYRLTVAPFIYSQNESSTHLSGSVSIRVSVLNATRTLVLLRSRSLRLGDVLVEAGATNVSISGREFNETDETEVVTLSQELEAGREYVVRVPRYTAKVKTTSYLTGRGAETKNFASSLGLKTHEFVPCVFDGYSRATVDISVIRRSDFNGFSNTESVGNSTEESVGEWWPELTQDEGVAEFSWVRETFATTEAIPLTLLQFVVAQVPLRKTFTDAKGRQHRFWSSNFNYHVDAHFAIFEDLLNSLEVNLGLDYSANVSNYFVFPTYVSAAHPDPSALDIIDFSVGIATVSMVYENGSMYANDVFHFLEVVAMSFYQIFLGQVAGGDSWILDSLARVSGAELISSALPMLLQSSKWRIRSEYFEDRSCILDPEFAVNSKYSACSSSSYSGASVFYVLRMAIGSEAFDSALGQFVKKFASAYGPASAMLQLLVTASAQRSNTTLDVGQFLQKWTTQPGVPVVTCSVQNGQLVLRQQPIGGDSNSTWPIPLAVWTGLNSTNSRIRWNDSVLWDRVQWLTQRQESLPRFNDEEPAPVYVVNLGGRELFRVNYDAANWVALTQLLRESPSRLHRAERATLIDDSFELARAGLLNYSVPLELVQYMGNETWAVPRRTLAEQLSKLDAGALASDQSELLCQLLKRLPYAEGDGSSSTEKRPMMKDYKAELVDSLRRICRPN